MHHPTTTTREAEHLWFLNSWLIIRRSSAEGPDGVSIIEHHDAHGDSPPTHVHHREDEIFHLLEGRMRFRVGDQERVAMAGETVVAPRGLPHTFRVESPEGARYLTMVTGPGFERLVREVGSPATARALPHPLAPTPQMIEHLARIAARSDIDIVGPPLAPAG